jgi:GH24 family phage-related lysozyme (muramidase)
VGGALMLSPLAADQSQLSPMARQNDGDAPADPEYAEQARTGGPLKVTVRPPIPEAYMERMKTFEGYSSSAYPDYKQYSIGYGTRAKYPGERITQEEANSRYQDEVWKAANLVDERFPGLPQGPRAALVDLTYNSGTAWMNAGLGSAVANQNWPLAQQLLGQYVHAGGRTLPGLVERRGETAGWMGGAEPGAAAPQAQAQQQQPQAPQQAQQPQVRTQQAAQALQQPLRQVEFTSPDVAEDVRFAAQAPKFPVGQVQLSPVEQRRVGAGEPIEGIPFEEGVTGAIGRSAVGAVQQAFTMPVPSAEAPVGSREYTEQALPHAGELAGLATTGGLARAGAGLGAGGGKVIIPAGEELTHGISQVKLPKPVSEMAATYEPTTPVVEKQITPAEMQGGLLIPGIGDRSIAGQQLTGVAGEQLPVPVELQGGPGYMPAHAERGAAWASGPSVVSALESKAAALSEKSGKPIYFPYTAMGERAVDFSHHISDTLAELLKGRRITNQSAILFDRDMRRVSADYPAVKDWPGVKSRGLRKYLANAGGDVRNKFAKTMDTRFYQDRGFPSVALARFAVTDPRLLHERTGASGLQISRVPPGVKRPPSLHRTYPEALPGQYVGGFGASIPKELMYPDIIRSFKRQGYEPWRFDYLLSRLPARAAQTATQQWVDRASEFLRSKGVLPSGAALAVLANEIVESGDRK